MLTGLGHRAVGCADNQNRTVHLCCAGDHVLDVVGVAGAVDVCIVPLRRLVLDVCDVDGDSALPLFGGLVDHVIRCELCAAFCGEALRDCGGKRGLAVIDVSDCSDVQVRLGALKLFLCHSVNNTP